MAATPRSGGWSPRRRPRPRPRSIRVGSCAGPDQFDGQRLPDGSKWGYDVGGGGFGNGEAQYYTDRRLENARVEDGRLILEARKENWGGNAYTSARLVSRGKGDWLYGKFETRARFP